jgi:hypothetical protein
MLQCETPICIQKATPSEATDLNPAQMRENYTRRSWQRKLGIWVHNATRQQIILKTLPFTHDEAQRLLRGFEGKRWQLQRQAFPHIAPQIETYITAHTPPGEEPGTGLTTPLTGVSGTNLFKENPEQYFRIMLALNNAGTQISDIITEKKDSICFTELRLSPDITQILSLIQKESQLYPHHIRKN